MQNLGAGISENDKHIFAQFVRAIHQHRGDRSSHKREFLKELCVRNERILCQAELAQARRM